MKLLKEYIPASSNYKTWPIGVKTPLAQAAMYGKVEVMRYLLSAGLDPNLGCSSSDKTSLYYAARNNQIEAAQLLLDHGACADPRLGDPEHSLRLLDTAGRRGFKEMAKLLLKHIDVNSKFPGDRSEHDALMATAATCGLTDLFQLVLDEDPSIDSDVPWGKRRFVSDNRTPLLLRSVRKGHKDVVALLLDYGAEPYGTVNASPFLEAVSRGHADIVQLLLDRGAEVSLKNQGEYTLFDRPLDMCTIGMAALCYAVKYPPIFRLLLDRGVHINPKCTAAIVLRTEIARSDKDLTDLLREKGYLIETPEEAQAYKRKPSLSAADRAANNLPPPLRLIASVNPTAPYVMNILQDAIQRGDLVTVTYLLSRGCNANLEGFVKPLDPTSVELAVSAPEPKAAASTLDVLLHHGANINALKGSPQPQWYRYSMDEEHLTAIRLLVERGASTDSASEWVKSTLMHCGSHNHYMTMQYLLRVMCDRGMSLDEFQVHKETIGKQERGSSRWRFERALENTYWRIIYPVP